MELNVLSLSKLNENIDYHLNCLDLHINFIKDSDKNIKQYNKEIKKAEGEKQQLHKQFKIAKKRGSECQKEIDEMKWQEVCMGLAIKDLKRNKSYDEQFLTDSKKRAKVDMKETRRLVKMRNKILANK